jgi:hypothetical protein
MAERRTSDGNWQMRTEIPDGELIEWLARRGGKYPRDSTPRTVGPMMVRASIRLMSLTASNLNHINRIAELEAELEATRQSWVDGEAPDCEEVCVIGCKGPCGVTP